MPARRVSSTALTVLLLVLLLACNLPQPSPSSNATPAPAAPEPAAGVPTPIVLSTHSGTIGPDGGTIAGEGWRVVVPAGAVADTVDMAVSELDAAQYLDAVYGGIFLRVESPVTPLARPAQIRVALPAWYTPEDAGATMSLLVDEATGELLYESTTVEMHEGQPELVLETDHFSDREIEWVQDEAFYRFPPDQADALEVPYYSQSGTPYCWAGMSQMVAEGARHSTDGEVYGFIGVMGIDPSAKWWEIWKRPAQARLRVSPALGAELTRRAGKAPERIMWITFQQQIQVEYIQREIAFNRRAVGLFSYSQAHAFVLVGYPDRQSFYVLDPRDPDKMYTVRTLAELGLDGTGNTTVVIPSPLAADRPLISINLGDRFMEFVDVNGLPYPWRWDFRVPTGFALTGSRPADNAPIINSLPGEVAQLVIKGPADHAGIEIANAHLSGPPIRAQVTIEIQRQGPSSQSYVQTVEVTVPPKTMVRAEFEPIRVDEFRDPSPQSVVYTFKATVSVDGTITDEASFSFVLDPRAATYVPTKPAVNKCMCSDGQMLALDLEMGCMGLLIAPMDPDWQVCYRGCLEKCGCDPNDPDLTCACQCVMGK